MSDKKDNQTQVITDSVDVNATRSKQTQPITKDRPSYTPPAQNPKKD